LGEEEIDRSRAQNTIRNAFLEYKECEHTEARGGKMSKEAERKKFQQERDEKTASKVKKMGF
jgi:hypothetical protein